MKKVTPIFKHNAVTGTFKRPNHPDFATSSELKAAKFSGVRHNKLGLQWEFWILGDMVKTVTFQAVALNSKALQEAHIEVFAMAADPSQFKEERSGR